MSSGTSIKAEVTHVIFDLDGLLLDTESLYTESTQQILDRYGLTFEWAVKARMMGRRPLDAAQVLVDALQLPLTAKEFHAELYRNLMEKFPNAKLLPGAETLIRHLRSHGIPTAIATGSAQSSYEVKISQYGDLFGGMSHAVCSDDPDVKEGKPSPYIYQVAASRFQTAPKSSANVLVFEDAPNGLESAKAAGMNVVMVPDGRTDPQKCLKADSVLGSLEELDLTEWGLPPISREI